MAGAAGRVQARRARLPNHVLALKRGARTLRQWALLGLVSLSLAVGAPPAVSAPSANSND